ncbi:GNAT family N-acetyltransferase [Agromyces sp. PvR057]|uniref:GNAT family N-acetyltransferase n=1 Tax=Agromyces sp. PvR057 TaxID=3156403 RepID=UPI001314EED8
MNDAHSTTRLMLTPLTVDDVDDMFRVYGDERTWQHLPTGRHVDRDQTARAVEKATQSREAHGFGMNAVRLRVPVGSLAAGDFVGVAGANMLVMGAWNLGYRFEPEAWGHGLAGEAARLSLEVAVASAPDAPVTARVFATNPVSIRVLERLGLDLAWRGSSGAEPLGGGDTTHLERLVFTDRDLDDELLDAVIALG